MKILRIIAVGDELLNGAVSDTNSSLVAAELERAGFRLDSIAVVPDRLDAIVRALTLASEDSDLIITTGGLGPTSDDLTRHAIANFAGVSLVEDGAAKSKLEEFFKRRGRQISENNYRQVLFPDGAVILTNDIGTADGFVSFSQPKKQPVISLPGVPRELSWLLKNRVVAWVSSHFGEPKKLIARRYLKIFGLSESFLGTKIEELKLEPELNVSYRPNSPEILLTISTDAKLESSHLIPAVTRIREAIGDDFVFSTSSALSMAEIVTQLLQDHNQTIAVAESCSGGKIADLLTDSPGVSSCFLSSAVTYSNHSKMALVDVAPVTIEKYGAVSAETAAEMASGIRTRTGASIGISTTGIAGPDGGSDEKPVGTFFVGFATDRGVTAHKFFMPTERNLFRRYVAFTALDLVRRHLTGLTLDWKRQ